MSKVFIQNGTGSTATLENAHNEKIPIYDTLQDAEADLANIEENQIVATQDNGNNNRFVTQSEYKADNTYSTTETDTGKTWIDGKKIYRRVFYSATNWPNQTVVGNIPDIDTLIEARNVSSSTDYYFQDFGPDSASNSQYVKIDITTGDVIVGRTGNFVNSHPSTVIIEYTKTGA